MEAEEEEGGAWDEEEVDGSSVVGEVDVGAPDDETGVPSGLVATGAVPDAG